VCEEHQFPHHVQKRLCLHGQWQNPQVRCGKAVNANVIHLKAFECSNPHEPIFSLEVNQTDETQYALPTNSFHFTRILENIILSASGSNCYHWIVQFERKVEIAFLLIDINLPKMNGTKDNPAMSVNITHR